MKNENESLIIENSGIKNELKHMNEEHDKEKQKNNELNNNLNNIRNNYENKIKIINEKNNKELNSKIKWNNYRSKKSHKWIKGYNS